VIYRTYGQTGRQVSALGMGCMRFENPEDMDGMAEVVVHAFEKGVNYFDTAPYYCNDKSEEIVGLAVKEMRKSGKPFYISTKSGCSNPNDIRRELERSLVRLNLDAIDFYHVWNLVHPEQLSQRKAEGALDAFRKAKEEGLVRHICVSTHLGHEQVATMLDEGEGAFEGMLIGLNATNFTLRRPGAIAASERGLGVVTMNTLGGGMITDHPDQYQFLLNNGASSVLEAALRFNLSLPEVTVSLVGFRNKHDVDTATETVEKFRPFTSEQIDAFQKHVMAVTAETSYCTQCGYCRECPVGIPVYRVMEAYNHLMIEPNNHNSAINRLKWHWAISDPTATLETCTQCGHCETVCTQHLPILERFEHIKKVDAEMKAQEAKKNQ
jgi:predicted aldo/keto reductase-like oxidoreductase